MILFIYLLLWSMVLPIITSSMWVVEHQETQNDSIDF
jgi:hypothetical protein